MNRSSKATLALADGTVFEGWGFGALGEAAGEVVFNTALSGYQEILTDPSYCGQIVTMTAPHIGNVGVNLEDLEGAAPAVRAFVVKEASAVASNYRSRGSLQEYLVRHGIVGIEGIDTRALTRHLRDAGAQEGVVATGDADPDELVAKAKASPGLIGRDLVKEVTCVEPYAWRQGAWAWGQGYEEQGSGAGGRGRGGQLELFGGAARREGRYRVVAVDCGIKRNILRRLVSAGCEVLVVPAWSTAADILGNAPDGVVLSNGPGDPEGLPYLIEAARGLVGKVPIFGICLGHQILGLALGGRTYKLKFGHHGANHPVQDLSTGKVEITSQNHGFAVDVNSIPDKDVELTHANLNDGTVEGLRHRSLPIFSVQYHPEASPGPHDARYLFERFVAHMAEARGTSRPRGRARAPQGE